MNSFLYNYYLKFPVVMRRFLYLLFIASFLTGCASLSTSQIESIHQFGHTTSEFSAYPGKILTELADIREKRGLYYASTLTDPRMHIAELDSIFSQKEYDYRASQKADISFQVLDQYAQALILLSADETENLQLHSQNLGVGLDSLLTLYNSVDNSAQLPTGIGNAFNQLLVTSGSRFIKRRQAKEIKKFVTEADTLIAVMTNNLLEYLQSSNIQELIDHEERMISRDYLTFLQQTEHNTFESQKDYLELKSSITKTKALKEQTVKGTRDLRTAHRKLLQVIEERQKLKHAIKELQVFHQQVSKLRNTVREI